MKFPHRRQFLRLTASAAALPVVSRIARAQTYPARPVHVIVGFTRWQHHRHRCTADRPIAVGTARSVVHY